MLKGWIESSFAGQCDVFVSSDQNDIPAGSRWLNEIEQALKSTAVLLVLCSPASLRRPWINFETGCAWIKHLPILPLCHSGQRKGALPAPISTFQALEIEASNFTQDLLSAIAKHLDFPTIPRIKHAEMAAELASVIAAVSPTPPELAQTASTQTDDFPGECIEVMSLIAGSARQPTAEALANHFGVSIEKMRYYLGILTEKELVRSMHLADRPTIYSMLQKGREVLVKNGRL